MFKYSYQLNISGHLNNEGSCLVFMMPEYSLYALSQISKVHVKFLAFGIENNIRTALSPCSPSRYLQNVEMTLICQGKTGNGYKLSG